MTVLLGMRRCAGAARTFIAQLPEHFRHRGPEYPPLSTRLFEQAQLLLLNAIMASDYYYLGLYRPQLSWSDKRNYIGHYLIKRTYAGINSPRLGIITAEKKIFHMLCLGHGLPVMDIVASYSPRPESAPWPCVSSFDKLRELLQADSSQDLFLKPGAAQKGYGALSLGSRIDTETWENLPLRTPIRIDDVMAHIQSMKAGTEWIVQRRARPHPEMAKVVPDICSTVRVITLYGDVPRILGAIVRFGEGRSPADNYDGGGIVAMVDLETGVLGPCLYAESGLAKYGERHPYTGARISGMRLPDWKAVKDLMLTGARAFSGFRCIGWDVGITDAGPVIIEGNSQSGFLSMQNLGHRGLLDGPLGDLLRPQSGIGRSGIRVPQQRGV